MEIMLLPECRIRESWHSTYNVSSIKEKVATVSGFDSNIMGAFFLLRQVSSNY